jgi:hypothetical protein
MRRRGRRQSPDDLVTAAEIAAFVYGAEAWRLEHGVWQSSEVRVDPPP